MMGGSTLFREKIRYHVQRFRGGVFLEDATKDGGRDVGQVLRLPPKGSIAVGQEGLSPSDKFLKSGGVHGCVKGLKDRRDERSRAVSLLILEAGLGHCDETLDLDVRCWSMHGSIRCAEKHLPTN